MIILRGLATFVLIGIAVPIVAIFLVPYVVLRSIWKLASGEWP